MSRTMTTIGRSDDFGHQNLLMPRETFPPCHLRSKKMGLVPHFLKLIDYLIYSALYFVFKFCQLYAECICRQIGGCLKGPCFFNGK
jgi:hypothetical protein